MLELNKIYCEDCLDTMSRMTDDFIDLTVTSPPYNISTDRIYKYNGVYSDDLSDSDYFNSQKEIITELIRVNRNYIFYNIQLVSGNKISLFNLIAYFKNQLKDVLIWDKYHGEPAISEKVMNSSFEFILVFTKNKPDTRYFDYSFFKRGSFENVIRHNKNTTKIEGHKAVFPGYIPGILIKYFSKKNDLIYDPFIGSGTTGKMAYLLNRNWIGSEISQEYVDMANKRIEVHEMQLRLF